MHLVNQDTKPPPALKDFVNVREKKKRSPTEVVCLGARKETVIMRNIEGGDPVSTKKDSEQEVAKYAGNTLKL